MALTIDALKGLFKKLGGSDSGFAGVNTIPEAIDKVTSVASSSGGDLPTPGAAGNVLTSTGDGWESAEPTLNIEGTMSGGNFTITNVTAAQINAAYMAHRPVYIDLPAMHARVYLQICEYTDDSSYKITFCNTQITSDGIVVIQASFNDSLTGDVDSKTAAAT